MSIGGDIKFLRLKQRGVEGLVCDGGIRDMHVVKDYGPLFFGYDKTSNLGTRVGTPYATNDVRAKCTRGRCQAGPTPRSLPSRYRVSANAGDLGGQRARPTWRLHSRRR